MENIDDKKRPGKYTVIAWTGLLTSTLDAVAAILSAHKMPVATVFKLLQAGYSEKLHLRGDLKWLAQAFFFTT